MVALVITPHAVERYVERIGGTEDEAVAVLSGPAVLGAVRFGARVVRLASVIRGADRRAAARVLLKFEGGEAVVMTVVPVTTGRLPYQLMPHALGGPPPARDQLAHLREPAPPFTIEELP